MFIFKVTEPSSIPYRTHSACAKMATYPDPPPVIPVPDTGVAGVTSLPSPRSLSHISVCVFVCFFVLCNRHWFNRVPGPNRDGGYLSTLRPCSDAGYADLRLPLPLLGAPVSIEAAALWWTKTEPTEFSTGSASGPKCFQVLGLSPSLLLSVDCLFLRSPSRVLYRTLSLLIVYF